LIESRRASPNFRPLFKTKKEALDIINVLKDWVEPSRKRNRKGLTQTAYTREQYRMRDKFEIVPGNGTNVLHHRDTGLHIAIHEDMFDIILECHIGMDHACTA